MTTLLSTAEITPQQYGVGARFTLSVYDSDYVRIILDALGSVDATGLEIETDSISTFVGGSEGDVLRFLRDTITHAANSGAHISAQILLSRGCPGGIQCELPDGVVALTAEPVRLEPTGVHARAHWSLYPLLDGGDSGDHMSAIYRAIDGAKASGIFAGVDHYATRLEGDLAGVLEAVGNTWIEVGASVQHVTTHVTISINSPSREAD